MVREGAAGRAPSAKSSLSEATALILAGGLGTRLSAVVSDRAKPMAEVSGRPFILFLLDFLAGAGVKHAVLCTGHRGEGVRRTLGSSHQGMALEYSQEDQPLGTGGALRLALPLLRSDAALVLNGDSFFGLDLETFWTEASLRPGAVLAVTRVQDTSRYGRVELDSDGRVLAFREKESGTGLVNAGVYRIPAAFLAPCQGSFSLEREAFPAWIGRLWGQVLEGPFLDIGTPESYGRAEAFFRNLRPPRVME
jgi:NDP-sugar pyrophosphorylase family protein